MNTASKHRETVRRSRRTERRKAIRDAYKASVWYRDAMNDLCSDPMTDAMGVPVGDFAEDWSCRSRRMCQKALRRLQAAGGHEQLEAALIDELTNNI